MSGYDLTGLVSGTPEEVTFRGRHESNGAPVLVEMYRTRWPTERELAARRHGFEVGTSLAGTPGVVEHLDLVEIGSDLALVMADPGGISLEGWLRAWRPTDLLTSVRLGVGIANAISEVHASGVIHNSLSPASFHVDPASGATSVASFARSSRLRTEASGASTPGASIAYMSPEQTGRMNRPVDSRSDLYVIGVILFQMLTGRLPFTETDNLALVHAQIARRPPSVVELHSDVPRVLAEIVATLLNKNANDRYATASGLADDLERAASVMADGEQPAFDLRQTDVSDQLVLPEGLYGRDEELEVLRHAVSSVDEGERRALFVAGYSGIGKSQLVNEIQPVIVERSGWFGGGKYDLYRRDIPYLGWIGAIESLVKQALTLADDDLEVLRSDLRARLGPNRAALTEVVPRLTALVGDPPPLPEATPTQSQARFDQAFRNLVHGFASPESPLVLFVDDLQWADLPSLRLLEALMTDREASDLLVLGAWRDNEVGPDHPLQATLRRLDEAGVHSDLLELGALAPEAVSAYVADTFGGTTESVGELSGLVRDKTGGNPFFMRQFLVELDRDDVVVFDREKAVWVWDLPAARGKEITENVADLMARRVGGLGGSMGHVVQLASCIGGSFTLAEVTGISGLSRGEVAEALNEALEAGLILPMDDSYRYATSQADVASAPDTGYAFTHDRVQESAHESLQPEQRAEVHLNLARQMLDSATVEALDEASVLIASHLSEAHHLLTDAGDRLEAADVFLRAGTRAKTNMATDSAAGFLDAGLGLLPDDAWDDHYRLALALHTEAADVAYIDQRFADIDKYAPVVLSHAVTPLDRVPIHNINIGIGVSRREYREATEYAVDVLSDDFGINLPKNPNQGQVMAGVARVKLALRGKTTDDLLSLAPMVDPELHAVMGILMKTATNAYWATPNLVPLIAFRMCELSVKHGNIGLSAYGYALYGMITSAALGQVEVGQRFGQLAMDLLDKTGDTHLVGKTALLWQGFIRHNKVPIRECGAAILGAYDVALDAGDIENAVYCGTVGFYTEVLAGHPIPWLRDRYAGYVEAMLDSGQDQTIGALRAWLQCIDNLASSETVTSELVGDHVDFTTRLPELIQAERGTAIPVEVAAAGFLAFLLGEMEKAEKYLALSWESREDAPGQPFKSTSFAFYVITQIRKRASGGSVNGPRLWRVRRDLAKRARHNPHDLEPLIAFIEAEDLKAAGDGAAAQRYLDAAALSKERGFLYLEALTLEEAAELHEQRGHGHVAAQLWVSARSVWGRYGASARLAQLGEDQTQVASTEGGVGALAGVDTQTLLNTVQAVSEEIELDGLVGKVLTLSIRNAGARYGALIVPAEDGLETIACATLGDDGEVEVQEADDSTAPYPKAIVDYAIRTSEPILLDDATTEELFSHDPYVVDNTTRSVLCVPLLSSGNLVGVLYLENDVGVGVFTERHLFMLRTIGGQAAVSLENARLFEDQRAQAEAFARFVPRPFLAQLHRSRVIDVVLGDAIKTDLAVLFSDIRAFTTLSEGLDVEKNFALLNEYLAEMEPPIHQNGGFIDKFIGDAVMALFAEGAESAVAAGVGMHQALRSFNERNPGSALEMGIGVHYGPAMLGTVGSPARMDTTVIGDTVNTASRLEGMTKKYMTPLLISNEVARRLGSSVPYATREVGRVRAVGKEQVTTVHEVLDARPESEADALAGTKTVFERGLDAWYRGDLEDARELFGDCVAQVPGDGLARSYANAARDQLAAGVPVDWDGIYLPTEK